MKKKNPVKIIIICVLLLIPLYLRVFKSPDADLVEKIGAPLLYLFAMFMGSGVAAVAGALAMHYASKLFAWVFDERSDEKEPELSDDLTRFSYGLLPVIFIAAYYFALTGKI